MPKRSPVKSRKNIDTSTYICKDIKINIPIISSNMDTVTESEMAITMARLGGLGIIHRFLSIEDQVKEVQRVKRAESYMIENPLTITKDKTLKEARELMSEFDFSSLIIVDDNNHIAGIMTHRDIKFEDDETKLVKNLMTPKEKLVTVDRNISLPEAKKILNEKRIEKLPVVQNGGTVVGLITSTDVENLEKWPNATKDRKGRLRVGAAIGVKDDYIDRAEALLKIYCDVLVLDIAHGHSDIAIEAIKNVKAKFPNCRLIAGNVATREGAIDLIKAGADGIKVGVGPGSICTTRIVTGAGVPQVTALLDCKGIDVPVIADGGIKYSGDITKALVAGADCVMLGSLLAGTKESPGTTLIKNGRKYKISRGMASFGASSGRKIREKKTNKIEVDNVVPEGVEAMVPYRGMAHELIFQLIGGLKSGMSYCGASNISDMKKNAEFIKMTSAGRRESGSHDVELIK